MPIKHSKYLLFTDHKKNKNLYISVRELKFDLKLLGHDEFTFDCEFSYPDYEDYHGPSNLAHIILFKEKVQSMFARFGSATVCSCVRGNQFNNSLFLIACFLILEEGMGPDDACAIIDSYPHTPFFGIEDQNYSISILDVLNGFFKMIHAEPSILENFDPQEYLEMERPSNGDANWVIPGKILAMAGPKHPFFPFPKFKKFIKKHCIKTIVRLNRIRYTQEDLSEDITVIDMFMKDGSNPSEYRRKQFIKIVKQRLKLGPIAVHCRAGLGRTGSLICAYLMDAYHLTADESIGFVRIMRPGSVLCDQPQWLRDNEVKYNFDTVKSASKAKNFTKVTPLY